MNASLITYEEITAWLGLDPDDPEVKPYMVRDMLEKNGVKYIKGKGNKPCTTIELLANATPENESNVNIDNVIEIVPLD